MRRMMLIGTVFLMLAVQAGADELTWAKLVKQPEYMPAQCTVKKAFEFQSGMKVKAGQKMNVLEYNPQEIVLQSPDGRIVFGTSPADTDVLALANAAYAALTPEQRALTVQDALKRPELWPYALKVKDTFDLGRVRINKGDTVYLMAVEKGELVIVPKTYDMHSELMPQDTDFLEQARANLVKPAPGRIIEELKGKLVKAQTGEAVTLDAATAPKYFIFYHAARWCPYTQKFTPGLKDLYLRKIKGNPDYEVIYIPAEKSAAELQTYAKELDFPWPAIKFSENNRLVVLAKILGRNSIPEFGVVDRFGNIVIDNYNSDRDTALKELEALLSK